MEEPEEMHFTTSVGTSVGTPRKSGRSSLRSLPMSTAEGYDELLGRLDVLLQSHHDRLVHHLLPHMATGQEASPPPAPPQTLALPQRVRPTFTPRACTVEELGDSATDSQRRASSGPEDKVEVQTPPAPNRNTRTKSRYNRRTTLSVDRWRKAFGRKLSTFSKAEEDLRQKALVSSWQLSLSHRRGIVRGSWYDTGLCTCFRKFAGSLWLEGLMSMFIVGNAIFCGWEVEYLVQTRQAKPPSEFNIISIFFAVIFTLELMVRMLAEGRDFVLKKPNWRWNLFDTMLVSVSIMDISVDMESAAARQLPAIRIIRIARVIRVLRVARIMRHFRSLRILVNSVLNTLRSLFWTMALLGIILYMFGILFTQATLEHVVQAAKATGSIPGLEEYYGSISTSAFTLFMAISGGVDWELVVKPLAALHPMYVALFLVYFYFTYFAVLNVMTGVFCQTAIESAHHDHDMAAQAHLADKQLYIKRLQRLFNQINFTESGQITLHEFEQSMQDEKLKAYFASIDLSVDEAFSLFKLLDHENTHVLNVDTFITGCLKLRGAAKSMDIAMMTYETRWNMQRCLKSINSVEEEMLKLRKVLADDRVQHASGEDMRPPRSSQDTHRSVETATTVTTGRQSGRTPRDGPHFVYEF